MKVLLDENNVIIDFSEIIDITENHYKVLKDGGYTCYMKRDFTLIEYNGTDTLEQQTKKIIDGQVINIEILEEPLGL